MIIKTWLLLPIIFLSTNCLQKCVNGKPQVPCLFIFGDSMSDSGNNNNLPTDAKVNYNPYGIDFPEGPTGRFTNGRTTIDIITQLLGFKKFIPPFENLNGANILKGVNYASGGAGIRDETSMAMGFVISLRLQLKNHRVIVSQIASILGSVDKAQKYLKKCLYYVHIGSNDYINNYFVPEYYASSHMLNTEQYAKVLIQELSSNLQALHDTGARKYVLVGLGDLGCTPNAIITQRTDGSCVFEQNAAAAIFDTKLKSLVDNLNNKFSADSTFILSNSSSESVNQNSNGFLVTNAPCCPSFDIGGLCIPDKKPCSNRNEYVFWDQFHTSEAWNQLIATRSYNSFKHLVEQETKMELKPINEITAKLSASS